MQDAPGSQAACFASTTQFSPGPQALPCTLHPRELGPETQGGAAKKQGGRFNGIFGTRPMQVKEFIYIYIFFFW